MKERLLKIAALAAATLSCIISAKTLKKAIALNKRA